MKACTVFFRSWAHRGARIVACEWDNNSSLLLTGDTRGKVVCFDLTFASTTNLATFPIHSEQQPYSTEESKINNNCSISNDDNNNQKMGLREEAQMINCEVIFIAETAITQIDFSPKQSVGEP